MCRLVVRFRLREPRHAGVVRANSTPQMGTGCKIGLDAVSVERIMHIVPNGHGPLEAMLRRVIHEELEPVLHGGGKSTS